MEAATATAVGNGGAGSGAATASAGVGEKGQRNVALVSSEGDSFVVPFAVAKLSKLVETMCTTEGEGDDDEIQDVPLPNLNSKCLSKIVEFLNHYLTDPMKEIEKPLKSANMSEIVQEWYERFVDLDQEALYEIILASNYMDIKPLLDLTCAVVASMVKGKTPEEIRKTFNIENDFSPEEEAQVREENKWCEEA